MSVILANVDMLLEKVGSKMVNYAMFFFSNKYIFFNICTEIERFVIYTEHAPV